MNQSDSVATIAILLAAALVGGMIAHRLRQPVMLGYLIIGAAVGPHAFGLVDDVEIIRTTATIGVTLLMFTLGLEVSIAQLREVGRVGIWGGIAQIITTLAIGLILGLFLFRWPLPQASLFGLIVSLSSTTVCLKILMERGELSSVHGRIMLAILVLQDIGVVMMMVVMPLMGGTTGNIPLALSIALGKGILFVGIAIVSGRWILPWLLGTVGGVRARELFLLTVLVLCLAAAVGTEIFGLSIVFGAFLVGLVLRETRFARQALAEITPLRDIFATLFFVSLGMLFNPLFLINNWQSVVLVVVVIIVLKLSVVFGIVKLFGYSFRVAILTGAGLFQIGEFGFILAQGGVNQALVTEQFYSLIISGAIITMLLTPLSLSFIHRLYLKFASRSDGRRMDAKELTLDKAFVFPEEPSRVVIAGYGRVGESIANGLQNAGIPFTIIDVDPERISEARGRGRPRIYGDAANRNVLRKVDLDNAKVLVLTYPDPMAVEITIKNAMTINPRLKVLARAQRRRDADKLKGLGVTEIISPEYEAGFRFIKRLLKIEGVEIDKRRQIYKIFHRETD